MKSERGVQGAPHLWPTTHTYLSFMHAYYLHHAFLESDGSVQGSPVEGGVKTESFEQIVVGRGGGALPSRRLVVDIAFVDILVHFVVFLKLMHGLSEGLEAGRDLGIRLAGLFLYKKVLDRFSIDVLFAGRDKSTVDHVFYGT